MKELPHPVETRDTAFSAALLAGGKSTRMGFDKATLVVDGQPLWQRQIHLLERLGAAEVFISGPTNGPWQDSGIAIIEDDIPQLGPMGALVSILQKITTARVLVLAVDMPEMTADFLLKLLAKNAPVIPLNGDYYEPLVAIYSTAQLTSLKQHLENDQRSLQTYLRENITTLQVVPISLEEKKLFTNINELQKTF